MEVYIRIKCTFDDPNALDCVKQMLSDDPPLFEDEVPKKYEPIFHAFEDSPPPESSQFQGKKALNLEWTLSSSWLEDISPLILNLLKVKGTKTYTCAMEDEVAVVFADDHSLHAHNLYELAEEQGFSAKTEKGLVTKAFNYLAK